VRVFCNKGDDTGKVFPFLKCLLGDMEMLPVIVLWVFIL
jgi:hypothetical protein